MITTALFSWKNKDSYISLYNGWLWTGAVNYAKRSGMRCVLVSDDNGINSLVNVLKLPFDEVLSLPHVPNELQHIRDLTKISALSLMAKRGECVLHVDHDLFLRRPLSDEILSAPFAGEYFYESKEFVSLINKGLTHPRTILSSKGLAGGIMGGTDLQRIISVCNQSLWIGCHPANRKQLVEADGYQSSVLLGESMFAQEFPDAVEVLKGGLEEAKKTKNSGYLHMANAKQNPGAMCQAAELVRLDFPEEYRKTFDNWDKF